MKTQESAAGDGELRPWALFLLVFVILGMGNLAATLVVIHHSGGDKGWWPVHLGVFLTASCVYALLFSQLSGTELGRYRSAALYALGLALVLNAETFFYYGLDIDWLAVNERRVELTFPQQVIGSAVTPWVTYFVFLVGAALLAKRTR